MFKHTAILAVAVVVALAAAKGLVSYSAQPHGAAELAAAPAGAGGEGGAAPGAQAAEVMKGGDGQYWAQAEVDGRWVRFVVDTGASVVALTREDARRLGLDPESLNYATPVSTANGQTKAAEIELDHVSVAGARVDHVPAMVVHDGLQTSLLGMSYLGRLSRFEATRTALILRP